MKLGTQPWNENNDINVESPMSARTPQKESQVMKIRFWKEGFWKYIADEGPHPGQHPDPQHRWNDDENEYLYNPSPRYLVKTY